MLQDICHNLNFKHLYIVLTLAETKNRIIPKTSPSYTEENNLESEVILDGHILNIFPNTTYAIENNQDGKVDNNIRDTSEIIETENVPSDNFNEDVFIMDISLEMECLNKENVIIENEVYNMDLGAGCPTDDTLLIVDNINEKSPNNEALLENNIGCEKSPHHESVFQSGSEENLAENCKLLNLTLLNMKYI